MSTETHGLNIGIERTGQNFFLNFKAVGKLTHEDYQIITPMIDSALEGVQSPSIDAFFDLRELQGWEARVAWDDFKLGLKHGKDFNRVALLGNKKWQEVATKVSKWFISGDVQFFEDEQEARNWLN
ncbi:STAS/SEC14 domain-containing protein [Endozoicomonas sp. 8E]|uniref:STAS/SEC14 domain-containing protein n=1 Tax=Endozoicomonas sp. 8E TaxID=3035692 RepID=UPI0029390AA8|nr:STAS/SEC14 domain-containing protein [Endozoicomonas sp. 8E]WOG25721.1 STAS/SEC14 domain-containing protein [Endozoicomonas sp. 8E]